MNACARLSMVAISIAVTLMASACSTGATGPNLTDTRRSRAPPRRRPRSSV